MCCGSDGWFVSSAVSLIVDILKVTRLGVSRAGNLVVVCCCKVSPTAWMFKAVKGVSDEVSEFGDIAAELCDRTGVTGD